MAIAPETDQIQDPFLQSILRTVDSLREQTSALLDLVSQSRDRFSANGVPLVSTPEVLGGQRKIADQVATLRTYNRHLARLARDTKATTGVSRAEVDRLHLGLQNLYYEQRHLVGEIAGCEEYSHPYTRLPLIAAEEFLTRFPEWNILRQEEGDADNVGERGLMRARILEEKRERQELEAKRMELVKRKAELVKENLRRKDDLGNLDKQLETFIEVSDHKNTPLKHDD